MENIKNYEMFLEFKKEILTKSGRWLITPKTMKDNIDLDDTDSTINTDEVYVFRGVTFTPKYNKGTNKYYTLINRKVNKEAGDYYPSWVAYSKTLKGLKSIVKDKITEYIKAIENDTIFESSIHNFETYNIINENEKFSIFTILNKLIRKGSESLSEEESYFTYNNLRGDNKDSKIYSLFEKMGNLFEYESDSTTFKFEYKFGLSENKEERYYGIMHLPDLMKDGGVNLNGTLYGSVIIDEDGDISTDFTKEDYIDYDFVEGLEKEYDAFNQELTYFIDENTELEDY